MKLWINWLRLLNLLLSELILYIYFKKYIYICSSINRGEKMVKFA
jgi:hypothetical protein